MNLKSKKVKSYRYGKLAETFASLLLNLKGYRIVERNSKTYMGEIDIIAKRGKVLSIIEVKARRKADMEALTMRQMQRIHNAAMLFVAKRPEFANSEIRFDLILVKPFSISHIMDCWRP